MGLSGLRIENLSSFVAKNTNIRCCSHEGNQLVHSEYARVSNTFSSNISIKVWVLFSETACCIRLQPPLAADWPEVAQVENARKQRIKNFGGPLESQ